MHPGQLGWFIDCAFLPEMCLAWEIVDFINFVDDAHSDSRNIYIYNTYTYTYTCLLRYDAFVHFEMIGDPISEKKNRQSWKVEVSE